MIEYWLKLKFWLSRKFYEDKDVPSPLECAWALFYLNTRSSKIKEAVAMRSKGFSLNYISYVNYVTRERVRQQIKKGVRDAWVEFRRNNEQ